MKAPRQIGRQGLAMLLAGATLVLALPAAAQPVQVQPFARGPAATPPALRLPPQNLPTRAAPPFFREPTVAEATRARQRWRRTLDGSGVDPQVPRAGEPVGVPDPTLGSREIYQGRGGSLVGPNTGIPAGRIEVAPIR